MVGAILISSLVVSCSGGSLGEVEPLTPLFEARHQAEGAARLIDQSFTKEGTNAEYMAGLILYNKAFVSVNTLIDQMDSSFSCQSKST